MDGLRQRDPKRIDEVLRQLAEVWKRHPDLRLGQLVVIATNEATEGRTHDPFYVEDVQLVRAMQAVEKKYRWK